MKKLKREQLRFPHAEFVKQVRTFAWDCTPDAELKSQLFRYQKEDTSKLYSILTEIIFRCTGLRLFDTQIGAAYAMQQGRIAELPTGEGKTLSAVLTAASLALQERHVHVLAFNDYLARRDYLANREIYEYCGVSSSYIDQKMATPQRQKAYGANIVYLAAKEAGFDFLKNFLCREETAWMAQNLDVAIVDEADSIMIDEARIPLVLAGSGIGEADWAIRVDSLVRSLVLEDVDVRKNEQQVWLSASGIARAERTLQVGNLFDLQNGGILSMVNAALEARFLLFRDKDYVVKDGAIQIIDEATGRIVCARRFPDMLHRAIEAKEGVLHSAETVLLNSIPMQFFLMRYELLCGMTGTIKSAVEELKNMYGLDADLIPPHMPCVRKDHDDAVFQRKEEKEAAIISEIRKANGKGQPVLLGTQSVAESERYSFLLDEAGLSHFLLNAKNDEEEALIIAEAGRPFRITISTNMAGRGVDIKLRQKEITEKAGGLYVIGCGINRSLRIDHQLSGRAGRQGDPGESRFFISVEDPFFDAYVSERKLYGKSAAKAVREIQKWEEGRDAEARYMLEKYAYILEIYRRKIAEYHETTLRKECQTGWEKAERQLTLHFINQHFSDFLITMENVRNSIHLTVLGGLVPIVEYHRAANSAFLEMEQDIKQDVASYMEKCKITDQGIDLETEGLAGATTTWTYMINESKSQFVRLPKIFQRA